MEKKQVLVEYKKAVISAIDLALDNILNIEDLMDKEKNSSKEKYISIKNKIENDEELTPAEYSLLSIICLHASNSLTNDARRFLRSAENMQNLAKVFIT